MPFKGSSVKESQRLKQSSANNLISLALLVLVFGGLSFALFSQFKERGDEKSIWPAPAITANLENDGNITNRTTPETGIIATTASSPKNDENMIHQPVSTPEPAVIATPTGIIVYSRVMNDIFSVPYHRINVGDTILWDNYDIETGYTYTIVELNDKIGNITLLQGKKTSYVFNTTGKYVFALMYPKLKGNPSIQTVRVISQ